MNFLNKVVLVTGAGSGIGEATAMLFAKKGADVVIVDINKDNAAQTATKCETFGKRVLVLQTDVTKTEEVKSAINRTIEEFGQLDVLVNNAGIIRQDTVLSGTIMNTYDQVMNTNLRAIVEMTTMAAPHLIKAKGCIVNTSSIASKSIQKGSLYPAYTMSKAGVDCFTRLAALELATSRVRVNAVNPGPVSTNLLKNANLPGNFEDYAKATALGRISDPTEVARLIVYLASNKAKGITGSTYCIDNGLSLM